MLIAMVEQFAKRAATRHRVRDLSSGGVRIDNVEGLQAGATVLVSVGSLEAVGATVRWVRDGFAGLAFAEQIDPNQARTNTAIAPRVPKVLVQQTVPKPTAGWIKGLRSPYQK